MSLLPSVSKCYVLSLEWFRPPHNDVQGEGLQRAEEKLHGFVEAASKTQPALICGLQVSICHDLALERLYGVAAVWQQEGGVEEAEKLGKKKNAPGRLIPV